MSQRQNRCSILIILLISRDTFRSSCSGAITRLVQSLPSVSEVDVNLVLNSAVVIHDPDQLSVNTLVNEIEDIGYGATLVNARKLDEATSTPMRRTVFGLEGMTCRYVITGMKDIHDAVVGRWGVVDLFTHENHFDYSACSGTIDAAVSALPGVESVSVSLIGNSMEVVHDSSVAPSATIINAVEGCGYDASEYKSEEVDAPKAEKDSTERIVQVLIQGFCEYVLYCPLLLDVY